VLTLSSNFYLPSSKKLLNKMRSIKKIQLATILVLIGSIIPFFAMAQTDPGCGPDCPIDGGIGLLLAAGVGYGVKKYRERVKSL
jgi:hypothetical protein